jgi:hypothetical protein
VHSLAAEQLTVRARTAPFDEVVNSVWLFGMLFLPTYHNVDLAPSGRESPNLSFNPKQKQFGHISEVEANAATVRAAVLANFEPDYIRFVREAPRFHNRQGFG